MNDTNYELIKITNEKGEIVEAKAITVLQNPDNDKKYLLYSFDTDKDYVDIYASLIIKQDDVYVLDVINDKKDWNLIQNAIRELQGE